MSKEKQIKEMAHIVSNAIETWVHQAPSISNPHFVATAIYYAGYRKQSEWISVEERLPDCEYGAETEALLFRLKTGTVEAGYFGTGGMFRDKYFRCYHHANEGWDAKDVTHWMPLPEPPKGDHHE